MHHLLSSSSKSTGCECPHHIGLAVVVILFGLTFLLQALGVFSPTAVGYIWPSIVILGGVFKLVTGMCACCSGKARACGGTCGGSCGEGSGDQCSTEEACCAEDKEIPVRQTVRTVGKK